jgi:hypothetical protein
VRVLHRVEFHRIGILLAAGGLCVAGCGGRPQGSSQSEINTGLAHVGKAERAPSAPIPDPAPSAAEAELLRLAEESAANLQALFAQLEQRPVQAPEGAAVEASPSAGPGLEAALAEASGAEPRVDAAMQAVQHEPTTSSAAALTQEPMYEVRGSDNWRPGSPDRPLQERIQEMTFMLVDLLRQYSVETPTPMKTYLSLAAMEALWPGALQKVITPVSLDGGGLTHEQITAVETLRDLLASVRTLDDGAGLETERLMAMAESVLSSRPMRVRAAVLCARVTGFGQYTPLSSNRFLHGRNHPVIVYTEVAPFEYRRATSVEAARGGGAPGDGREMWAVELSQQIQIYLDSDGLLVWSRPEETVLEVSRNRRRDFFLVNEVILPRTLSVGRYRMKITMRDRTGGAVDEAVIPFEVVADPALAGGLRD